ncbi:MAG: ribosomal RNA small subunit methyltransferase A [Flavobacteriales bacterium]|nr:ribosomal RNA small subunit methyltransferase A [Flavobacteriales bacterium]MCB9449181.1 ribosomal RNA small subunit methyltransferase A [Flavobacteriales bacterium]
MRAKKKFGQHFLKDTSMAMRIVDALEGETFDRVLEIGPGKGVLTDILLPRYGSRFWAVEIDREAVEYLHDRFREPSLQLVSEDFLRWDLSELGTGSFAVIGNFPYNISSQILFRVVENRDRIPVTVGMFQKEVADRVRAEPGSKVYGILSVWIQAFYEVDEIMTVLPDAFHPPPKVKSAVIRLRRLETPRIQSDPDWFLKVVKTAFNQRRKTLRNALKTVILHPSGEIPFLDQRAETLSVEAFDELAGVLRNQHP